MKLSLRDANNLQLDIDAAVRLRVVPYGDSIGIIEVNDKGHTVRQVAYFDSQAKTWLESDGSAAFHCTSPVKRPVNPEIVIHSSNPEFEKLGANNYMEALRDRTVKVDFPDDWGF